jgi:hypothetical protein
MHPFRAAVEAQDLDAMVACLADDIEFHSPVAHKPFVGKDAAAGVLGAVFQTLTDFHYTDELTGDGTHALFFRASVGGKDVQGVDYVHENGDGLIDNFTVMFRPLSAIVAMGEAMAPKVEGLAKAP